MLRGFALGALLLSAVTLAVGSLSSAAAPVSASPLPSVLESDRDQRSVMLRGSTADFVSVQCQPAEAPGFNASEPPRPSAQATLQALLRFGATPPIKQIRFSRWQDGLSAPSGVHLAQGSCQPGYAMCPNGKCCATGMQCTDDGFCVQPGRIYCGGGRSCSAGESCAGDGFCVGAGLVYCGGGRTCPGGTTCTNDGKCNDPKRPACPPGQGLRLSYAFCARRPARAAFAHLAGPVCSRNPCGSGPGPLVPAHGQSNLRESK